MYLLSSANFKKDPQRNIFFLSVHAPATSVQQQLLSSTDLSGDTKKVLQIKSLRIQCRKSYLGFCKRKVTVQRIRGVIPNTGGNKLCGRIKWLQPPLASPVWVSMKTSHERKPRDGLKQCTGHTTLRYIIIIPLKQITITPTFSCRQATLVWWLIKKLQGAIIGN